MLAVAAAELNRTPGAVVSMAGPHVGAPIDANGNLTGDGTRTFEWDARNQLTTLNYGTSTLQLHYGGDQKKRRTTLVQSSTVMSDEGTLWCGSRICEERDWTAGTALGRFESAGQLTSGASQFFGLDHLGTVKTVTDGSGTVLSRFEFDPWGRRSLDSGSDTTPVSFTGHHQLDSGASALVETAYRYYSADLARWLSEDPSGIEPDLNMFRYAANRPLNYVDPNGLAAVLHCESIKQSVSGTGILLPVRHCYIQVECEELDETLEIWGPGNDGRPGYGRPRRLPSSDDRRRQQPTISREILGGLPCKECDLERKLVDCYESLKDKIPPYVASGPNSNTFAQQVIQCSGGRVRFPWNAPGAR